VVAVNGRAWFGDFAGRPDASDARVDFICSGAFYLSDSHRNMERAGMRVQFTRAVWTPL
jgi:hypothetical protein